MIAITDRIALDEAEIAVTFIRASGPGGQNVNKVSSAAQLRFDVRRSPSLPDAVRVGRSASQIACFEESLAEDAEITRTHSLEMGAAAAS
jgi:protein subunit release factor B